MSWTHLIRFESQGRICYGDAIFPEGADPTDVAKIAHDGKLKAAAIEGDVLSNKYKVTSEVLEVTKLLSPLTRTQVPIIRCIGLNYMKHSKPKLILYRPRKMLNARIVEEGGRTPPPYPSLFIKPSTSLAAFDDNISIPRIAQETLDYEGELVSTCVHTAL